MRITGPYAGHYIAALAHRSAQGGWTGYAKVFSSRPTAYSDAGAVADIIGSWVTAPSELDAVESAERVARTYIAQMDDEPEEDTDL